MECSGAPGVKRLTREAGLLRETVPGQPNAAFSSSCRQLKTAENPHKHDFDRIGYRMIPPLSVWGE